MKRDFLKELKARISKIDHPLPPTVRPEAPSDRPVKLYNIHKRSLPVGIDKPVVFSVTKSEAEWWTEYVLKPRSYENGPDDSKTIIYYDVLPIGATPRERSIYYNPRPVSMEE